MTEETPKKKPRKKRRTKAQIEAEKAAEAAKQSKLIAEAEAAEAAAEKEIELQFGSSYEKEIDAIIEEERCIPCEENAAEALAKAEAEVEAIEQPVETPVVAVEPRPDYIPKTGLAKLRDKIAQRKLRDRYRNAGTKPSPN